MSPPPEAADQVGAATLERMAAAPRYNRWMFDRLRPWVGRRVLEIGAGIGNMSALLVDRERVVLTDTERYYLDRLRQRFGPRRAVREALRSGLSPAPYRVFQPGRRAGMVGRRSRVAPPAHSHRRAALVRSTGTAVPAGAAAPLADRSVAHRHRRGAGMMSRQQSTDDILLSVIVPAYNEAATIEATLRQLKQVPLRVEVIAVNDA